MLHDLWHRIRALLRRRQLDDDLEAELAFHLEREVDALIKAGHRPADARRQARLAFGGVDAVTEACRDTRGIGTIDDWSRDLRYAARLLVRHPGFTAVTVLSLAIGIGGTTAMVAFADAALLRPLPYTAPERLVELQTDDGRAAGERRVSYPDFEDWRRQATTLEAMAAAGPIRLVATGGADGAESLVGEYVSERYFELLGVTPTRGRTFAPDEVTGVAADRVTLIGEGVWQRRFGGDADVVGRALETVHGPFEIIGVLPAWFEGITGTAELWIPAAASRLEYPGWLDTRDRRWHRVVARLETNATAESASNELAAIAARLADAYPATNAEISAGAIPLGERWRGELRAGVLTLLAGAGLMLAIGCANVSTLLAVRTATRRRELATRLAVGASTGRLLRQLLVEHLLLALAGGLAGTILAGWLTDGIVAAAGGALPSHVVVAIDGRAALFALVVSVTVGAGFGLLPGLVVARGSVGAALRGGGRQPALAGARIVRRMVAAEVALVVVLAIGALLVVQSYDRLRTATLGFRSDALLAMEINPSGAAYAEPERLHAFTTELRRRLAALPGVDGTALAAPNLPPRVFWPLDVVPDHRAAEVAPRPDRVELHRVTPDFFDLLEIPRVAGRVFDERDHRTAPPVAMVSRALAARLWPGETAVGRRFREAEGDPARWVTVVGVVGDVRYAGLRAERAADLDLYYPLTQSPASYLTIAARTRDVAGTVASVRRALRAIDPALPVLVASTVDERLAGQRADTRVQAMILGGFALVGLVLAAIGIYGVAAYAVSQRTAEIGLRIALGAGRGRLGVQIIGRELAHVAVGLASGIVVAALATRALGSVLYGVGATDLATFVIGPTALLVVALAACLLPARRAICLDPLRALQTD